MVSCGYPNVRIGAGGRSKGTVAPNAKYGIPGVN